MRRPVDPLGYSKDTGICVCRSDPVHQLGRIAAYQALRLGIGASTCSMVAITL